MIDPCPCGLPRSYAACCGRYHSGEEAAPSPEALMRSRYTAYVLGLTDYLLITWHASTRPATLGLDSEPRPRWLGLKVLGHAQPDDTHASVEFVARYKLGGRGFRLHEVSRFVREAGRWYYLDGQIKQD